MGLFVYPNRELLFIKNKNRVKMFFSNNKKRQKLLFANNKMTQLAQSKNSFLWKSWDGLSTK